MSEKALLEAIGQLSARVSNLEGDGLRFWMPILLSVVAIAVSMFAIYRSKVAARQSALQLALQGVKANIDSAKAQIETISMQVTLNKKSSIEQKESFDQILKSAEERLLNSYNDGCQKYYKGQIDRQDFIDLYHEDIGRWIQKWPEKFTPPLTSFDAMLKYYKEKHKNPPA